MVERVKCTYCGKMSYTSSPRFADKCTYCGKPFVKPRRKGSRKDKRRIQERK